MSQTLTDSVELSNGVQMPVLGLGTWQVAEGDQARRTVAEALELGYRHIDTAMIYENERSVGQAVRDSGLPREQVFVTTKCWNTDMRSGKVVEAFEKSLRLLDIDYVDLYLLHWAVGDYAGCWDKMRKVLASGKARAIGVSNFLIHHLEKLSSPPTVNQIEYHPWLQSTELRGYCQSNRIVVEAWSPIMQGKVTGVPALVEIGRGHGKSPAQVALRWALQRDVVVIPKSTKKKRLVENADVFDFTLTDGEMAAIDALDRNHRLGADPDNVPF